MRHPRVNISGQTGQKRMEWERGNIKTEPQTQSRTHTAPAEATAVKGRSATPLGKREGAGTAIVRGWLIHIEVGSRVRGRAAVQRVTTFHSLTSSNKRFCRYRYLSTLWLTQKQNPPLGDQERAEKNFPG